MTLDQGLVQQRLNATVEALKAEWGNLVSLALELPSEPGEITNRAVNEAATALSFASRAGTESIKRKLMAIRYAQSTGLAPEEITAQGQEVTVSTYNASRKAEQLDQKVWLQWKVTGILRELVQQEYTRICRELQFVTSEQFWEWLFAQLHNLTSEELKHSAGEPAPRQPAPPVQRTAAGKGKPVQKKESLKSAPIEEMADAGPDTSESEPT